MAFLGEEAGNRMFPSVVGPSGGPGTGSHRKEWEYSMIGADAIGTKLTKARVLLPLYGIVSP